MKEPSSQPYLIIDPNLTVVDANESAFRALQTSRSDLCSSPLSDMLEESSRHRLERALDRLDPTETVSLNLKLADRPGVQDSRRRVRIVPGYGESSGELFHLLLEEEEEEGMGADLASHAWGAREFIDQIHEAVVIVQDGVFKLVNPRMEELTGLDESELVGSSYEDVLAQEYRELVTDRYHRRIEGDDIPPRRYDIELKTEEGTRRQIELHVSRIQYDGNPAVLGTLKDITDRKRRERELEEVREELEQKQHRLNLALDAGEIGVWERDLATGEGVWDDRIREIFNGDPGTLDDFLDCVHPEDRPLVERELERSLEAGRYHMEHRIVVDEEVRWISAEALVLYDDEGKPETMIGTNRDITERKQLEEELTRQKSILDAVNEVSREGILVVGSDEFEIKFYNRTFAEQWNLSEESLHGKNVREVRERVLDRLGRPEEFVETINELYEHPTEESRDLIRLDDGRIFDRYSTPLRDPNSDDYIGRAWFFRDVTDQKRYQRELETLNTRLRLALEGSNMGVWERDLQTDELYWDERSRELFGYGDEEFSGVEEDFLERVHPEDLPRVRKELDRVIEEREPYETTFRIRTPDGAVRWIESRADVQYEDGEPRRVIGVNVDFTERKRHEKQLRETRDQLDQHKRRLELALNAGDIGVWENDLSTGERTWDDRAKDVFRNPDAGPESLPDLIHPDDRDRFEEALERSLETGDYQLEYRYIPEGEDRVRWVRSEGVVVYGEDEQPEKRVGTVRDITERKQRLEDLETLARRLQLALEGTNTGVWEMDLETGRSEIDEQSQKLFGFSQDRRHHSEAEFLEKVHPDDRDRVMDQVEEAIRNDELYQVTYRVELPNGEYRWIDSRADILYEDGEPRRMIGVQTDITELKEANRKLEELAKRDSLTGLANKRELTRKLEQEWNRARRNETPLALVIVDVDRFKEYNDRYGHSAGDDVLETVGDLLNELTRRPGDMAARFGGDEFVLILPETTEEGAYKLAREARNRLASLNLEHDASPVKGIVSVSAGVAAEIPERKEEQEELFKRADRALYRAKQAGQDAIRRHSTHEDSDHP